MKKRTKVLSLLMAIALTAGLTACGSGGSAAEDEGKKETGKESGSKSGDGTVELVFSGVVTEAAKLAAEEFIRIAEEESNGTIKVTNFPDNQLGDDRVVFESTRLGDIDISVSSTSPLANMYADFYLFDTPYLFMSKDEVYEAFDGDVGRQILEGMETLGLKGLALWENGFRNLTNNEKEITKPEDVKGLKLRTMENDIHLEAWKAIGANPAPMAGPEVFTALQQGTIDAQENPYGVIDGNKFYEVQKYISTTEHVYTPFVVSMNLEKYNALTDTQKKAIDRAAKESTAYQREESARCDEELREKFKGEGVTITDLTVEQKEAFRKLVVDGGIFDLVKGKMEHPEYLDVLNK